MYFDLGEDGYPSIQWKNVTLRSSERMWLSIQRALLKGHDGSPVRALDLQRYVSKTKMQDLGIEPRSFDPICVWSIQAGSRTSVKNKTNAYLGVKPRSLILNTN